MKLTSDDLLDRLKKKGTREPAFTKALIIKKLNDDDDDVATTSLKVRITHYLFTIMNHQRISTFKFCFPVLLGILRNLNWKEFLKSRESFLRKVSVCTLTDLWHFWTSAWNSKFLFAKRLLLRHYESAIYKKYPWLILGSAKSTI